MTLESYMAVMANYRGENAYLNFSCKCYMEKGAVGNIIGGKEGVGQYTSMGGRTVQIRETDEINVSFTDHEMFYSIDTDLGIEEIERFIENLK